MSMKHYIYITLAIALSIVTACTEHPIVQVPQVPESSRSYIFFEPEVLEAKATKAEIVEGDELPGDKDTAFGVLGYYQDTSIFGGYDDKIAEVYRKEEDSSFQYDHLGWWLNRDAAATTKHNFFAFYPYSINENNENVVPNNGNPYINYTLPTSEADMEDILTAYKSTARVSPVQIVFQHRLWALDLEVVNSQTGDGYSQPGVGTLTSPDLHIVSVKLTLAGIPATGTLAIDGNLTSTVTSRKTQEYTLHARTATIVKVPTDNPETEEKENTASFGPLLFLPTDLSYGTGGVQYQLDFTFENHWGDEYTQTFQLRDFKLAEGADSFEPGKRYKLTVVKTDTEASVDLDVTGWTEKDVTHTFN